MKLTEVSAIAEIVAAVARAAPDTLDYELRPIGGCILGVNYRLSMSLLHDFVTFPGLYLGADAGMAGGSFVSQCNRLLRVECCLLRRRFAQQTVGIS